MQLASLQAQQCLSIVHNSCCKCSAAAASLDGITTESNRIGKQLRFLTSYFVLVSHTAPNLYVNHTLNLTQRSCALPADFNINGKFAKTKSFSRSLFLHTIHSDSIRGLHIVEQNTIILIWRYNEQELPQNYVHNNNICIGIDRSENMWPGKRKLFLNIVPVHLPRKRRVAYKADACIFRYCR